jgi:hypothetical protein
LQIKKTSKGIKMYDLEKIKPIQLYDLVRIGKNGDGGYVLSQIQVDKTEMLLSFGISDDWSFEMDFSQKKQNLILYAYDYSVSANALRKIMIKRIFSSIYKYLTLDFRMGNILLQRCYENIKHPFKRFFNSTKGRYFIGKFLGNYNDETFVSVQNVFDSIFNSAKELSVFVKMDIEQSEYRTLSSFKPFYHLINGFAIEFHDLDILHNNFTEIIRELSAQFYVAHVHANNYCGVIYGTNLPNALEITFINKKLITDPVFTKRIYPIEGLDFACDKYNPDITVGFDDRR